MTKSWVMLNEKVQLLPKVTPSRLEKGMKHHLLYRNQFRGSSKRKKQKDMFQMKG